MLRPIDESAYRSSMCVCFGLKTFFMLSGQLLHS